MGMQAVGIYLRSLREQAELTQEAAAALVGMSGKTVERWEAGKHEPALTTLRAYVKALSGSVERAITLLLDWREADQGDIHLVSSPLAKEDAEWFTSLSPERKRKVRALLDLMEADLPPHE
jgi:transcriptional regulator with XRE-family HTH domain